MLTVDGGVSIQQIGKYSNGRDPGTGRTGRQADGCGQEIADDIVTSNSPAAQRLALGPD